MSGGHERQDPLGEAAETVPALVVGGGVGGLNAHTNKTDPCFSKDCISKEKCFLNN